MTKDRICANDEGSPEDDRMDPNRMYCRRDFPDDASDKILQIRGLARIGAAATDSALTIDLEESGYLSLFEVIHQLCNEIWPEVDELQHKTRVGVYAQRHSTSADEESRVA